MYIEDGLYKVQVGAFRIRANAEKLVEELKSQGYEAIIKVV
jgi:N-acetylmuramoyl-L-alanine amidase